MTGSYKFTFLSCKRTVINKELHSNRRFRDFLEWYCFRMVRRTYGITDMDVCNTRDSNDGTDSSIIYFYFIKTIEFI